jgi:Cu/Ag efflux protein CusF
MLTKIRMGFCLLAGTVAGFAAEAKNCGCACCKGKEVCCCNAPAAAAAEPVKRHPLRGVVTTVLADKSALMVKHEAIPGVMRAMTMMFKVEPETLKKVRAGDTITGQMAREGDEWWLREVKVSDAAKR